MIKILRTNKAIEEENVILRKENIWLRRQIRLLQEQLPKESTMKGKGRFQ